MTILRIDPAIELDTTRGRGYSHFLLDYGDGRDTLWQVFLRESGESWWCPNRDVLHPPCWSLGVRRAECSVSSSTTDPGTDEEWTSQDEITERALVLANNREADLWRRLSDEQANSGKILEQLQDLTRSYEEECENGRYVRTKLGEEGEHSDNLNILLQEAQRQVKELQGELAGARDLLSLSRRRHDEEIAHSKNLQGLLDVSKAQVRMWRAHQGVDPATGLHEPPYETPGGVPQPAAPPAAPTLAAAPLAAAGGPFQPCSAALEPAPAPTLTAAPPSLSWWTEPGAAGYVKWSHSGYRWVRDPELDRDQS